MTQNLTPLAVCMRLIGPEPVIAEVLSYVRSGPYLWHKPAKGRDAGDVPSAKIMRALLAHSAANGLGLTADHLIWGASQAEIEEILAARISAQFASPSFTSRRANQAEAAA